jgi:predicted RNA-binding protein YlxR (DUF448 family)
MTRIAAYNGMVTIDNSGSAPGRGGYLHPEARCLEKFAASKVREFRSLKSSIDRGQRLRIIDAVRAATLLDSEARLIK